MEKYDRKKINFSRRQVSSMQLTSLYNRKKSERKNKTGIHNLPENPDNFVLGR